MHVAHSFGKDFDQFFCCIRCNLSWMYKLMHVLSSAESWLESDSVFSDYKLVI